MQPSGRIVALSASSNRPMTCTRGWLGDSSNECEWRFVSLCGPVINWRLVQGVTPPSPSHRWYGLQHSRDLQEKKEKFGLLFFFLEKVFLIGKCKIPYLDYFSQHRPRYGPASLNIGQSKKRKQTNKKYFL